MGTCDHLARRLRACHQCEELLVRRWRRQRVLAAARPATPVRGGVGVGVEGALDGREGRVDELDAVGAEELKDGVDVHLVGVGGQSEDWGTAGKAQVFLLGYSVEAGV